MACSVGPPSAQESGNQLYILTCARESNHYEVEDLYSEAMVYLASISSLLRRLAPNAMTATRYHVGSRAA